MDKGNTDLNVKEVIEDKELADVQARFKDNLGSFRVGMGAEAIKELLANIDLEKESAKLKAIVAENSDKANSQRRLKAVKRLDIIEAFRVSGNRPEWMILDVFPFFLPNSDLWFRSTAEDTLRPISTICIAGLLTETTDLKNLWNSALPILS